MSSAFLRKLSLGFLFSFLMVVPSWLAGQSASGDVSTTAKDADSRETAKTPKASSQDANSPDYDKRNRQLTDKEKKEQEKKLKGEVSKVYKKWLDEDVRYIITDEEKTAFKQLSNDEERDNFIEAFWARRDPTPDTVENEYKEEHYARIAYANEHFAAGIPGWKSDRGRIYIMYGKPDEIDSHPSGGS
jgi:GWxTD domain-containing protein